MVNEHFVLAANINYWIGRFLLTMLENTGVQLYNHTNGQSLSSLMMPKWGSIESLATYMALIDLIYLSLTLACISDLTFSSMTILYLRRFII